MKKFVVISLFIVFGVGVSGHCIKTSHDSGYSFIPTVKAETVPTVSAEESRCASCYTQAVKCCGQSSSDSNAFLTANTTNNKISKLALYKAKLSNLYILPDSNIFGNEINSLRLENQFSPSLTGIVIKRE